MRVICFAKKGPSHYSETKKKELQFWSEFISVVNNPEISFFFIITNKTNAKKVNWQPKTILKRSYLKILAEFVRFLKTTASRGKIITESEPTQDAYLIYAHNKLQSEGTGDGSISGTEYKHMVTSLSLVNKANQDIDVQLADTMALIAGAKYEAEYLKKKQTLTKTEIMKKRLLERKLTDTKNPSLFEVLI